LAERSTLIDSAPGQPPHSRGERPFPFLIFFLF
jgi:hypothetical protein